MSTGQPIDGAASGPLSVETERLQLRLLNPEALQAIAAGRLQDASRSAGCDLAEFPLEESGLAALRLRDLAADPAYLPWSLRVMLLKPDLRLAGHFNFHSRPGPDYLRGIAPGAVELGYAVRPAFQRRGLAEEAVRAMMEWAVRLHGVHRFVVSISPANAASVAMARKLSFRRIAGHVDPEDGYEDILFLDRS